FVEHSPELHTDRRCSLECAACDAVTDLVEFEPGRFQERLAFMCSELRELRITACDEPLIGILRIRELKEIAFIEEPQLQRAALDKAADLATLQRRNPRHPVDVLQFADRLVRDHTAVPDEHHSLQTEGL